MSSLKFSGYFGWLPREENPYESPEERKQREQREREKRVEEYDSGFQLFRGECHENFSTKWKSHLSENQFPWRGYVPLHSYLLWATVLFHLHITPSSWLEGTRIEWNFDKFSKQPMEYSFRRKEPRTMMRHSCPKACIFCDGTFPGCGHYLSLSPEAFAAERLKHAKFKAEAKAEMAKSKSFHCSVGMKYLIWEARRKGNPI